MLLSRRGTSCLNPACPRPPLLSLPAPAAAVRAYGDEAVGRILERVRGMVLRAKEQPEDSKQQNTTLSGVATQVGQPLLCC